MSFPRDFSYNGSFPSHSSQASYPHMSNMYMSNPNVMDPFKRGYNQNGKVVWRFQSYFENPSFICFFLEFHQVFPQPDQHFTDSLDFKGTDGPQPALHLLQPAFFCNDPWPSSFYAFLWGRVGFFLWAHSKEEVFIETGSLWLLFRNGLSPALDERQLDAVTKSSSAFLSDRGSFSKSPNVLSFSGFPLKWHEWF